MWQNFRRAMDTYASADRRNSAALKQSGERDIASLIEPALNITDSESGCVSLQEAIRQLNNCNLAGALKGHLLAGLCNELDIDPGGDNDQLGELLALYYTSGKDAGARAARDRCFVEDYRFFDAEEVLNRLLQMAQQAKLLRLIEVSGLTGGGNYIHLTLQNEDGERIYRTASSVVGVVDAVNEQLARKKLPIRYCSFDSSSHYAAYLIDIRLQQYLRTAKILQFDGGFV